MFLLLQRASSPKLVDIRSRPGFRRCRVGPDAWSLYVTRLPVLQRSELTDRFRWYGDRPTLRDWPPRVRSRSPPALTDFTPDSDSRRQQPQLRAAVYANAERSCRRKRRHWAHNTCRQGGSRSGCLLVVPWWRQLRGKRVCGWLIVRRH